ncbi:hypothetical protein ACWD4L_47900, partial [Streptomyces sp. NPDC002596]
MARSTRWDAEHLPDLAFGVVREDGVPAGAGVAGHDRADDRRVADRARAVVEAPWVRTTDEGARTRTWHAGAAFLHPLANAHQVKHILGAAAHAAR